MARFPNPQGMNRPQSWDLSGTSNPAITRFFNAVYSWMCVGLAVTALVAWYVAQHVDILRSIGGGWIVLFIVEIGLVMVISRAVNKIDATVATILFLLYSAING